MTTQEVEDHVRKLTASKSQLQSLQSQEAALGATVKAKLENVHQQLTSAGMAEGLDPNGDIDTYLAAATARLDAGLQQIAQVLDQYRAALAIPAPPQPVPGSAL
jgi:prefoldin subunit 5